MATSLKFYTDSHIAKPIVVQLKLRRVDVVRCQEVGMTDATDPEHLELATAQGRALVSIDRDFQFHNWEWLTEGRSHGGIFSLSRLLQGAGNIGRIVTVLHEYWQLIEIGAGTVEEDIQNHIFYVK